jgi:formate hydrogenlyase transcriptional activator
VSREVGNLRIHPEDLEIIRTRAPGHSGRAVAFDILAEATARRPLSLAEEPRRHKTILADLTVRLVCAPPERVHQTFQEVLETLTRTLGVDRCGLVQFTEDRRSLPLTHAYAMPGIADVPNLDFASLLPWFTEQIRHGRTLTLNRLPDDLPAEATAEAAFVTAVGLKSSLLLPLKTATGEVLGGLGLGSLRAFRNWAPEVVSSLEPLGSAFASALLLRRSETRLAAIEALNRTLAADLERSRQEVRELKERLDAEAVYLRKEVLRAQGFDEIVGTSAGLSKVLHQVEQVAAADSPVLILGETGTGKDMVARAIHDRSRRKNRPLVTVNCAALPDALIESELFGYEKGAFTGAVTRTFGRFEAAHGGSILLDEIAELPLGVQAKLLRVLEGGTFERLGSARTIKVDVRVMAATNQDLEKAVREGRFRADLYYRLNVFPLTVPPLRERAEDVPLLVWHFINARQGSLGRTIERVPDRLMRALEAYAWPGNVRELENVIERALIVTSGATLAGDASFLANASEEPPAGGSLDDVQRAHIQAVLQRCRWKIAGRGNAAERLGMKRGTLQFRMKKLGIRRPGSTE